MALPVSFYTQRINDNTVRANGSPESATWSVPVTTLTAANYAAKKALIDNLAAAVADVVIGRLAGTEIVIDRELISTLPATTTLAQRENKLLCRYHDATTYQKFQVSIPTFDLTDLPANSELLDLGGGEGAALKSAFEAIVVSPDNSANSVILDSAQFVGRNT
jgi:hypothetical protein